MAENKKNLNEIVIDDGSQQVTIKNQYDEVIGVFRFHPTDIGIVNRFNEMAKEFDKVVDPITDTDIGADGTVNESDDMAVAALNEAEKRLYKIVNYIFGGDMASAFFGSMHPFSPINGTFYCELVLDMVGKYISEQFERETAKYTKRVGKYTKGYTKK